MAWIESHQTLREHPKVYALMEALDKPKVDIIGHLHLLWWWCIDYAPTGDITGFSPLQIARAADWTGDPKVFVEALVSARFLDQEGENIAIHDWLDFCGQLMEKRLRRKAHGGQTADNGGQIPPKEDKRDGVDAYQPTNPTNPTKPKPTKEPQAAFVLPEWIDQEAWAAYEDMRKKQRKPMTSHIKKLAVAELDKLRRDGNDPKRVLEQSTLNSWQGLFPLKDKPAAKTEFKGW